MPARGEMATAAEQPGAAEMVPEPPEMPDDADDPARNSVAEPVGAANEASNSALPIAPATAATPGSPADAPEEPATVPPEMPAGDGFFDGTQCFPRCTSDLTDPDVDGQIDGFGFENGVSCIVVDSEPALGAVPCVPPVSELPEDPLPAPPQTRGVCPEQLVCPSVDGQMILCGCGTIIGFGERKQEIFSAGGDQRFLASAMMETSTMTADYPFGDVNPGPDGMTGTGDDTPKTGGAANFGIAKQNWTMIRQCHPAYAGLNDAAFRRGDELNQSLELDIQVYNECRAFFGDRWFGGHRNGAAGLNQSDTLDIRRFQTATEWVRQMLEGHLDDDVQFYLFVAAI